MSAQRKLRVIEGGAGKPTPSPTPVSSERPGPPPTRRDRFALSVAVALVAHAAILWFLLSAERFGGPKSTGDVEAIEIESIASDPGDVPASRGASLPRAGELPASDALSRPVDDTKPAAAVEDADTAKPVDAARATPAGAPAGETSPMSPLDSEAHTADSSTI